MSDTVSVIIDNAPIEVQFYDANTREAQLMALEADGARAASVVAQTASELARDQAADLVDPANIFIDVSLGTAEAAVTTGTTFKLVSSSTGLADVRKRTSGGSDLLYQEATVAGLGGDGGAQKLGHKRADTAAAYRRRQDSINDDRFCALDVVPVAMHGRIIAGTVGEDDDVTDDLNAGLLSIIENGETKPLDLIGAYKVSGPLYLQDGDTQAFNGAKIRGNGKEVSRILFAPPAIDTVLFHMYGGSGRTTNKGLSGFTIDPYRNMAGGVRDLTDNRFVGKGIGVLNKDQCLVYMDDFDIHDLHTGVLLQPTAPVEPPGEGGFVEFVWLTRFFFRNCIKGIRFERNGGNSSFHGCLIDGKIDIPAGGTGIHMEGITGPNYLYNQRWFLRLFGGSGTRTGIFTKNTVTQHMMGDIVCEGNLTFKGDAAVPSECHFQGQLRSVNNITFDCASNGQFIFDNIRNGGAFAASSLSSLSPQPLPMGLADRNDIGDFPAIFRMLASGVEALGMAHYDGGGANGIYLGSVPFSGKLEGFLAKWLFDSQGGLRFLNGGSGAAIIAGKLSISAGGTGSLARPIKGGLLLVRDGEIGGVGLYLADETGTPSLLGSIGAQFQVASGANKIGVAATVGGTTISNGYSSMRTVEYIAVGILG